MILAVALAACAATAPGAAHVASPLAAALGGLGLGLLLRRPAGDPLGLDALPLAGNARALLRQVIPVWQRTAELARSTSERDAESLTQRFANIHSTLELALDASAAAPTLDGKAIDSLIERHRPDLERLRADSRQAMDALEAALDVALRVDPAAESLARLACDLKRVARATHILGLNASVEAARSADSRSSFEVVAADVRDLAAQCQRVAELMSEQVESLRADARMLRTLRAQAGRDDANLALSSEIGARAVLRSLLGSLVGAVEGSKAMREAGQLAQCEIEAILVGLQGHDRINQMLQSVVSDLGRMRDTLEDDGAAQATSAAEWLQRLEASYTMEEMRSTHHGTKPIADAAGVEFF